ncbi:hypothetical protein Acsp06_25650 [Actinomycetospora sp. NBRC 106375]|uniref:DUF2795 domain-containing protein n=1 Tax=Actinomycetospora sp. NBRC 106375 TaxID=3032207 RepID=UPI0024A33759|nr:DUF2795 domain-containing protein [Actinomycetospora sp. NBRC 106375]GLZ46380.1 hypothetical protein Acsp06_25650 [Actinomycetospora sp. NBRC 106375]
MTDRDDLRVRKALQGMAFPADRTQVISWATDRGEGDTQVLTALRALPDRTFSTADDVVISVPQRPDRA